jgi:hypothetical protein
MLAVRIYLHQLLAHGGACTPGQARWVRVVRHG